MSIIIAHSLCVVCDNNGRVIYTVFVFVSIDVLHVYGIPHGDSVKCSFFLQ